jgi:ABC-2 type transport system ATP-binding protein
MVGHGWGGSGEEDRDEGTVEIYTDAGYNVLTWDARGFGQSGGTVMIDHPDFEAKDAIELIDFVADQPEAELDGGGDPRVGMDGVSYGGGIQFLTAAHDDRVDAIAPTIAWNTLLRSLYQRQTIKLGWDLALVGLGIPTSVAEGVFSPAGVQTGNQSQEFYDAVVQGGATGELPPNAIEFFEEHGPDFLLDRIEAPTLIVQGTVDTLFTLEEADRNFRALARNDIPLKMMWYCGGHGACLTDSGGDDFTGYGGRVEERKLAWFARHLKGHSSARTGPRFEWIDERGSWNTESRYPLPVEERLRGRGDGRLALPAGAPPSGVLVFATRATPSPAAVDVPIEKPPAGSQVLGEPRLRLTYRGTGVPVAGNRFEAYAQIVDRQRNIVVNNLATPIPLELDGKTHETSLAMERIASLSTEEGYELQLVAGTSVYDFQRGTGTVELEEIDVTLPVVRSAPGRDPGGGGRGDDGGGNDGGGTGGGGSGDAGGGSGGGDRPASAGVGGSTTPVADVSDLASSRGSSAGGTAGFDGDGGGSLPLTGLALAGLVVAGLLSLAAGSALRRRLHSRTG